MATRWTRALLGFGAIVAAYYAVLFLAQRRLLFPVPAGSAGAAPGAEPVRLELPEGAITCWFLPPSAPSAPSGGRAPLLLYAHGNGELAVWWTGQFHEPRRDGVAVLVVEYPGYGGAAGTPSERSITAAVLAAYDWAKREPRVDPDRIVAHGRSLGGAAAARLGAERPIAALVLESSFTSVRAFAARFLAPPFLVRDPFDSLERLRRFRGPLLVLHGERDEIAPLAHGRALAAAVPGAEFIALPCGHNDCGDSWPLIRGFLARRGLLP